MPLLQAFDDAIRCKLFQERLLSGAKVIPWGLPKGEFQAWLREQAGGRCKRGLKELIDAMTEVDALTVLSEWVAVGFDGRRPNCGKLNYSRIKEQLKVNATVVNFCQLADLLGQLQLGKRAMSHLVQPGGMSYYKAVLQSCDKTSLLTDYVWVKMVGEGCFGRSHLCTCVLVSRVDHHSDRWFNGSNISDRFCLRAQEPPQRRSACDQADDAV